MTRAYLHDLSCTNAPCRCRVLYPVQEQAPARTDVRYTLGVGLSDASSRITCGPGVQLSPGTGTVRVHEAKS